MPTFIIRIALKLYSIAFTCSLRTRVLYIYGLNSFSKTILLLLDLSADLFAILVMGIKIHCPKSCNQLPGTKKRKWPR